MNMKIKLNKIKGLRSSQAQNPNKSLQNHSTYKEPQQSASLSFLHMLEI